MNKWLKQCSFELWLTLRNPFFLAMPLVYSIFFLLAASQIRGNMSNLYVSMQVTHAWFHTVSLGIAMLLGILMVRRDLCRSAYEWNRSLPVSFHMLLSAKYMTGQLYLLLFTAPVAGIFYFISSASGVDAGTAIRHTFQLGVQSEISYFVTFALAMLLGVSIPNRVVYLIGFCAWMFGTLFMEIFLIEESGMLFLRTFHLSQFDGPLDMLLFLIGKAKIDIKDIFVSEVTDQYIQSVSEANDLDMEDASAFITMAATLIEIKSRSLLPKPEPEGEEEDPEQALIRQLQEYQRYKEASENMRSLEEAARLMFHKLPEEYPLPPPTFELTGLTLEGMMEAFSRVLQRLKEKGEAEDHPLTRRIVRDEYDVPGCMRRIQRRLKKGRIRFDELFSDSPTRNEVVTLFLALLEMIRMGRVTVTQSGVYDDIVLEEGSGQNVNGDAPGEETPGDDQ